MSKYYDTDKFLYELPGFYDNYYCNKIIFNEITKIDNVALFFKQNGVSFEEYIEGYIYFIELVYLNFFYLFEALLDDKNWELIHWGNKDLSDPSIKELVKKNPSLKLLYEMNKYRKKLSKIRNFDDNLNKDKKLRSEILEKNKIEKILVSFENLIYDKFEVTKKHNNSENEKFAILNYLYTTYTYANSFGPEIPNINLATKEIIRNYNIRRLAEKRRDEHLEDRYFIGYTYTLLYIYKCILKEDFAKINYNLKSINSWDELYNFGKYINNEFLKNKNLEDFKIFYEREKRHKVQDYLPEVLKENKDFDIVFSGRDIILFPVNDSERVETVFLRLLLGSIHIAKTTNQNLEIIEFAEKYNEHQVEYTYAIYLPIGGMFYNSSYWLIFQKIEVVNIFERGYTFKPLIDTVINKNKKHINLQKFKVKDDSLKRYINKKDENCIKKNQLEIKFAQAKGLATEIVASIYLQMKYGAKIISFRKQNNKTDIDIVAEDNDGKLILCQAKSTKPKPKDIIQHFDRLSNDPEIIKKQISRKILFIMERKLKIFCEKIKNLKNI